VCGRALGSVRDAAFKSKHAALKSCERWEGAQHVFSLSAAARCLGLVSLWRASWLGRVACACMCVSGVLAHVGMEKGVGIRPWEGVMAGKQTLWLGGEEVSSGVPMCTSGRL
jgi:hypothetical protein